LKQQLHIVEEESAAKSHVQQTLEKELHTLQLTHEVFNTSHQVSIQQVEDIKIENGRLVKLAQQVQRNLEHYEEALQTQRTELVMAAEKREAESRALPLPPVASTPPEVSAPYRESQRDASRYSTHTH
jgi:hypothetical protein